jgi:hypothetical protein
MHESVLVGKYPCAPEQWVCFFIKLWRLLSLMMSIVLRSHLPCHDPGSVCSDAR